MTNADNQGAERVHKWWEVIEGDCREVMAGLEPESVDAICTDPPYELGFMGKGWDSAGVSFEVATWQAAWRILKPGAHLLAFGGTRTVHRIAVAIEDAGFQIRDMCAWMFGSGFPKSHNLDGEWAGWGTALKPAFEPVIVARKPLIGTVAANVMQHGVGALNVDACRIEGAPWTFTHSDKTGRSGGIKGTSAARDGVAESHPSGRWPANVVLGCCGNDPHDPDCAAAMLDAQSGERETHPRKRHGQKTPTGNGHTHGAMRPIETERGFADSGGASRFFYVAKASRRERNAGLEGMPERADLAIPYGGRRKCRACGAWEWRPGQPDLRKCSCDVPDWENITTKAAHTNHHPTVKPIALMRWLVRLVTPPGGLVVDPFNGSGSTGIAAVLEGFRYIGIEQSAEYAEIARRRIAHWEAHGDEPLKPTKPDKTNTYFAGNRKVQVCPACDRRWHSGAKACEKCGGPLEWRDEQAERERRAQVVTESGDIQLTLGVA